MTVVMVTSLPINACCCCCWCLWIIFEIYYFIIIIIIIVIIIIIIIKHSDLRTDHDNHMATAVLSIRVHGQLVVWEIGTRTTIHQLYANKGETTLHTCTLKGGVEVLSHTPCKWCDHGILQYLYVTPSNKLVHYQARMERQQGLAFQSLVEIYWTVKARAINYI